jgi:teichuronic acid biosynthesis glycosyltransferase TuaH
MNGANRFLFPSANDRGVYALAEKLALQGAPTTAVTLHDWVTFSRLRPQWSSAVCPDRLTRMNWVFPTGYMGALEPAFRPIMRRRWRRMLQRLAEPGALGPWIICPYPWLVESLRDLSDDRLIYYNYDNYQLFRPKRAAWVTRQEEELVRRSKFIFCVARTQVDAFRRRFPDRAVAVRHLPLASADAFLNPSPGRDFQENTVGYVGNLVDRVDWRMVGAVARLLPDVEFVFVGFSNVSSGGGQRTDWRTERDDVLRLPNVRRIETVPQDQVARHYWSFGLTWIPYATDHIFNYASCPTKIMDGLASGRPVLSTDVPECRFYPEWIAIFHSAEQAANLIHRSLSHLRDAKAAQTSRRQVEFVSRHHTWQQRADLVQEWVSSIEQ